ncbi:MAG TPA: hypothetical protein VFV36_11090 [Candidatus Methylomirabilis sp.]|nr:hypothetical protein [Candidatus Methylomirabilis sp.]
MASSSALPVGQHRALVGEDRPRFLYWVEGEVHLGTLVDYGAAVEQAHYSGFEVSEDVLVPSQVGGSWVTAIYRVEHRSTPYDADDWGYTTLRVLGDEFQIRIDGRA